MLVIGLLVWPKSYVVTIMAITMPMGGGVPSSVENEDGVFSR
jgi:hypothetical protein